MDFTFNCKRKRCSYKNYNFPPFPTGEICQGVFNGLSVEITDAQQGRSLYDNGCYGKGSKSRGGPASGEPDETLLLGLEESCFLAYYLGKLDIKSPTGESMDWRAFLDAAMELNERFLENLACYLYLKSKNWVIKSGIKFGGDFLIYKESPRWYHASFMVIVQTWDDCDYYQPKNLKGVQRVAETSDKDVLILRVSQATDITTPEDIQEITVTETIVRRFNYSTFVQSKQH
nr:tRNA-splicing endonuclease subunit Sen2 [Drosophila bipectinata]